MNNRITEILGTKYPILQGGMHYVGYAEMAAAVSNAGGLGIITSLTLTNTPSEQEPHVGYAGAEKLRMEIQKCKRLTNKPFGVNVTKLPMMAAGNLFGDIVQVVSIYEMSFYVFERNSNNVSHGNWLLL